MSGCEILREKIVQFGNKVSHSKVRTGRKFKVNTHRVTLRSDALNLSFRLNIAASTLRSVNLHGFDNFVTKTKGFKLTDKAVSIKKRILSRQVHTG